MDEVRLAVEKGYRLLEIYEVYEYQVTQYSPDTGEGGAFRSILKRIIETES